MDKLPSRKNIRLNEYDYSKEGYYFITICTKNRECILSNIKNCRDEHCSSALNGIGYIVEKHIKLINKTYNNVNIDEFIIMPNHIHIILEIKEQTKCTVSKIIQQFKGIISKEVGYSIWQKRFYEHVIRDELEYYKIKEYIINNPFNWENDIYY